jgi:hypothetical protein
MVSKVRKSLVCAGVYDAHMFFPQGRGFSLVALSVAIAGGIGAQNDSNSAADLSSAQIVEQIHLHDQARAQALKNYQSTRHYAVEYHGFPADLAATMVVEASFDAASGKSFRVVSQTGSKFLAEKVLKRAIDSEKEASQEKGSTALTPLNYKFNLLKSETLGSGPAFVFDVEPLHASKFLYRGRIWVDAADFAVVKMETQPAKNPSFWISKTLIESTSAKTEGFWFPQKLRSETKVRLGGGALLTIDYGTYEVTSSAKPDSTH